MIKLNCTNCQTILEIDEAFAGGVCRCKHCSAIQTVPGKAKGKAVAVKKPAKVLYKKKTRDDAVPSSGLDELAQIISSSGLSGQLMVAPPRRKQKKMMLMVGGGAAALLVVVIVAVLLLRPPPQQAVAVETSSVAAMPVAAPGASAPAPVAKKVDPNFCGVPLKEQTVIYVLDRGSGTSELFSYLKEAALRSASSLGEKRKFQIVFWFNGSEDAYPTAGPTYATQANVELARKALDAIYAHGQSDAETALQKAMSTSPEAIILATGKGGQLDDTFVNQVMQVRKDRTVKIHTFDLGGTEGSAAMKSIAHTTGGGSHLISEAQLKQSAKD